MKWIDNGLFFVELSREKNESMYERNLPVLEIGKSYLELRYKTPSGLLYLLYK